MTWIGKTAAAPTSFDRVLGLLPAVRERFHEMHGKLWDPAVISPVILELCRLRVAALLGCDGEKLLRYRDALDAGLDEAKVAALPAYPSSALYSDLERACIAFAEQYVADPHGLSDADFAALRAALTPAQIATLTLAVATFDAMMRMRLALDIEPDAAHVVVAAGPHGAPSPTAPQGVSP